MFDFSTLERPKLRNRDDLEKQLAMEIAIGSVPSLDDAIRRSHIIALEYSAQLLFNDKRLKVIAQIPRNQEDNAEFRHLFRYLFFDRVIEVQLAVIERFYDQLPEEYLNAFLSQVTSILNNAREDEVHYTRSGSNTGYLIRKTLERIFYSEISKLADGYDINDEFVTSLAAIKHITPLRFTADRALHLRGKCPKLVRTLHAQQLKLFTTPSILDLIHPDEDIRAAAAKKVAKMCARSLRNSFKEIADSIEYYVTTSRSSQKRQGDIKKAVFGILGVDPSPTVRKILVDNIRHAAVLEMVAGRWADEDPTLARCAASKVARIRQRSKYAQEYQNRKKNKVNSID